MGGIGASAAGTIGPFIRKRIIPAEMTVTEAARRLGVGRPALSNLLNGKASLSPEMALRLEKTFGADRNDLLDRQARLERARRRDADGVVAAGRFVPPFLAAKARDIEAWATNQMEARQRLAVLLRTLVHSTGDGLRRVDFPGGDNSQRRGWDGWVEAGSATPWIPHGESGWEFSVSGDLPRKAEHDYSQRLSSTPASDRGQITFVFVTPRNWPQKEAWAKGKSAAGAWKAVRALDADDLEQWLEQSIAGQVWFADQLELPTQGCKSLDHFWEQWRKDCEPAITERMFAPAVDMHLDAFKRWLDKPRDPLTVAADSTGEAVAFVACLFRHADISPQARDRAVLIDSAETMRTLAPSTSPFIPIVRRDDVERELGPVYRRVPCIVVRPRNAVDRPMIELPLLGYKGFHEGLLDMGIQHDEVDRLTRESGRSPTILRRRLSRIPAIKRPPWAQDYDVARSLIPMVLAGAWTKDSEADRLVLSELSRCAYDEVEQRIARLRELDDPPVWCAGQYRGVASKIDALFAISGSIKASDVDDFLKIARNVLPEADPALALPEDQRRAAGRFDRVRDYSAVLRDSLGDTLVLLAVHGTHLLQSRLGVDMEDLVAQLIETLLSPSLTAETLSSQEPYLPFYAEASPERFLQIIEVDLQKQNPATFDLLTPVGPESFAMPRRTHLLWSLACLAWSPHLLSRVSYILARLSEIDMEDNWFPKPLTILNAVLHSWIPQTAAPLDERIQCLKMIIKRCPEVGWRLCVMQLRPDSIGEYNYRPRWRADATGFGTGVSEDETRKIMSAALRLTLDWCPHDQNTLGDLVEHLDVLSDENRAQVWSLVDRFAQTAADDRVKVVLRERICQCVLRQCVLFWQGFLDRDVMDEITSQAGAACDKLGSSDPVVHYGWLFSTHWVAELRDYTDVDADSGDHGETRAERQHQLRGDAMVKIWASQRWQGVTTLLADSVESEIVGHYVAPCVAKGSETVSLLRSCLSSNAIETAKLDGFMSGLLAALDEPARHTVLSCATDTVGNDGAARLFRCAPIGAPTWQELSHQPRQVIESYWRHVSIPRLWRPTIAELGQLLERLLDARRSHDAFRAAHGSWKHIDTGLLKRLFDGLTSDEDRHGHHLIDRKEVSFALDELDTRVEITRDEMARLELFSITELGYLKDDRWHGIPNLERVIEEFPPWFAYAVALHHRRNDGGEDPPGWRVDDPEEAKITARNAYRLLQRLSRIPGTGDDGVIHKETLCRWCMEVRRLCAKHGCVEEGDRHLGQLLSHAPADGEGGWPCRPVCEVMERIGSPELMIGFRIGVCIARGPHSRRMEDGGDQERQLAASWRFKARKLAFDYPSVSAVLEDIAKLYEDEATKYDTAAHVRMRIGTDRVY